MDETTGSGPIINPEIPQDDTEDVLFSPQADTGFGLKQVEINGQLITIHETHRLRDVLAVYVQPSVTNSTTRSQLEQLGEIYGPRIKTGQFDGAFDRLRQEYPRLYAKIAGLINEHYAEVDEKNQIGQRFGRDSDEFARTVEKWKRSDNDINLREYFFSKVFDALAIIAPEIDLEAPLSLLCED